MQSIKRKTTKIVLLFIPIVILVFLTTLASGGRKTLAEASHPTNILVYCLDESGYNTDALLLIGHQPDKNEITLMQLPRDTYVDVGSNNHKLNHLYYRYFLETKNEGQAARMLADFLSESFGIPVQHYVGLTLDGVADMIDVLGGVTLTIDDAMYYTDEAQGLSIDLKPGTYRLSGKEAVGFARYRKGYVTGDLGRLDAQKILLSSMLSELKKADAMKLIRLVPTLFRDVSTDMTFAEIAETGMLVADRKGSLSLRFLTLPGEATRYYGESGNWYFQLNKKNAQLVLSRYFLGNSESFDVGQRFVGDSIPMKNIYHATHFKIKEYTEESARDLTVERTKRRT